VLDVKCLSFNIELQHIGMSSIKFPLILCKSLFHVRTKLQTILNYLGMLTKVIDS